MIDQFEAIEDLWEDIIEIVNQYPVDINNDTLVTEWSGTITSKRRIVNRVLGTSDRYTFVDPNTSGLDGSDAFFSAGEHVDTDTPNNNVAAGTDTTDVNSADNPAEAPIDVRPDKNFQSNGDGDDREQNEVEQLGVGLDCKSLLANLQQQWNHESVMGLSRQSAYIGINHIVDFMDYRRGAEVTRKEIETLNDMERSLIR